MGKISAHVLDTTRGRPAAALGVRLDVQEAHGEYVHVGAALTNPDGRVGDLLSGRPLTPGTYRVVFETEAYFFASEQPVFYPKVEVLFCVADSDEHYHIPLLLSPFGYSTYRGS
jgi:5-hydroxyisourate hydrolase